MKTPSDELFLLIKALSPSEKRYFKVEVVAREKGANTAYYKLFDAIDKQEEYDEEELLRKHANEKFAKHFAMAKKYLFESLLRMLNAYHRNNSGLRDVHDKLASATIMHSRGLYAMSKKMFRTVKKIAEEHETFQLLAQTLHYELTHLTPNTTTNHAEELQELFHEQKRVLEILQLENEYIYLQELSVSMHLNTTYSRGDNTTIDDLLANPLLDENNPPKQRTLQVRYYGTIGRLFFIKGDYEKAFRYTKACVETLELLPYQARDNYMFYLTQLHNLFGRSLKAQRYDELESILHKLRSVPATSLQIQKFRYESLYTLEMSYYILMQNYEAAYALIPEMEQEHERWAAKVRIHHRIALFYNSMCVSINVGDYRRALDYANRVLNERPVLSQLYSFAKIVSIIIHSELNNYDILDATIRSTYRHLKKQGHLFRVEEIILKYLRRLGGVTDRTTLHTLLGEIRSELQQAITDPNEARALEYFDFALWIDAKLQDQTISEYRAAQRKTLAAAG